MRIGLVSPYAWTVPGGVNNHVMSLVRHLERAGNDVYVIAPAGDLHRSQTTIPTNFISAGRAFPVRSNGSVAYVNGSFFMLGKMSRILAPLQLDVVHVHEPTIPAVGAAATMMAKVPVVATFHAAGAASDCLPALAAAGGTGSSPASRYGSSYPRQPARPSSASFPGSTE